jgi:dipeptidyl aminopeptidase/acylaminoacyl peptidase
VVTPRGTGTLRDVKPADISLARIPGAPTVSPDGRYAVVPVSRADLEADTYASQLWLVPTDGSEPARELTYGWRDFAPSYSPDGRWLAFLRAERDKDGKVGKPQLHVMPTDGGEPRCLTDHPLGAGAPRWSPDSTRLAYVARVPEAGRYGTTEGVGPEKEPPRRITTLTYRVDDIGYLRDRPSHVFVIGLTDGPAQLTDGPYQHFDVDWSPDGSLLTFAAARHESADMDLRSDVWVCAPDGTELRAITSGGMAVALPRFPPDADRICFVAIELVENDTSAIAFNQGVWSVPVQGGQPQRLTDEERYHLGFPSGMIEPLADGVLFSNENRGAVELLLVPYDGRPPRVLAGGPRQVGALASAAGTTVAVVTDATSWGELHRIEGDGSVTSLTAFNEPQEVLELAEIEAVAPDGYPVHGWVVRPSGEGPHPVLLMIHGGPFTQYGWRLFDEAQVYAGAGYAVVMGNPRGSSGYGQAHGRAVVGNVGEVSATDLLALLDQALTASDLDGTRVGVLGGSHGGFMTTWLAAHHGDRFKAAASERAVNAIDSFTGSSDIGWFFSADLYGKHPEAQRTQSPLTYADQIQIPVLIIHSENDWRCPVEQGQRLFVALRSRGVPAEMLLFPGEGHELSRSGLPSHRVARFDAILDWFGRYL